MPGKKRHATESEEEVQPIWLARADQWAWKFSMRIFISSELPVRLGTYMAIARVGRALYLVSVLFEAVSEVDASPDIGGRFT